MFVKKFMTLLFLAGLVFFSSQATADTKTGFLFGYFVGSATSSNQAKNNVQSNQINQQGILYEASPEVLQNLKDELSVRIVSRLFCPITKDNQGYSQRFLDMFLQPNRSLGELFQIATSTSTPKTLLRITMQPSFDRPECSTFWFYYINK